LNLSFSKVENGLTSDRQEVLVEIKGDLLVLKASVA